MTFHLITFIKITTFYQNEFLTCYLIFNFRPTFFRTFKYYTIFFSYKVKTGGPKVFHPGVGASGTYRNFENLGTAVYRVPGKFEKLGTAGTNF